MKPIRRVIRNRPVLSYFVLTLAYSWVIWAPMTMIPGPGDIGPAEANTIIWVGVFLMYLGGFGPLVAAAIIVKFGGGDLRTWVSQILKWRVSLRWWLASLGIPIVAVAGVSVLYIVLGGPYDFGALTIPLLSYLPLLLFTLIFSGGLNEEPGWRGLAQPLLQERYSALTASLMVGVVFALWHLPLFVAPVAPHSDFPFVNTLLYFPTVVVWSVILGWLYNNSASVLLAMFFHAGLNASAGLIPIDPDAIIIDGVIQEEYVELIAGLNFGVYLLIGLVIIALFGRKQLARGDIPTGEVAGFNTPGEPNTRSNDE